MRGSRGWRSKSGGVLEYLALSVRSGKIPSTAFCEYDLEEQYGGSDETSRVRIKTYSTM